MPSRFQEHFEFNEKTFNVEELYYGRKSSSYTIDTSFSNSTFQHSLTQTPSTYSNTQCSLKRQNRVRTRRFRSNSQDSTSSNRSIVDWCKSKMIQFRQRL